MSVFSFIKLLCSAISTIKRFETQTVWCLGSRQTHICRVNTILTLPNYEKNLARSFSTRSSVVRLSKTRRDEKKMEFLLETRKKLNQQFRDAKLTFNPLFIWIFVVWCASKILQYATNGKKTVWEISWNWFLNEFGTGNITHCLRPWFNYFRILKVTMNLNFLCWALEPCRYLW